MTKKRRPLRWKLGLTIVLGLAVIATWLIGGHRILEPSLRAELAESIGIEPRIGFVLLGPDLNIYAYDVRFDAPGLRARVPWMKFEIPVQKLWGSGSTRAVHFRDLHAVVREETDLSFIGSPNPDDRPAEQEQDSDGGLRELVGERVQIFLEQIEGNKLVPLLVTDRFEARRLKRRSIAVEIGPGESGWVPFRGATMRVVPTPGHLIVSDFKLRAFGGLVGGLLDLHLEHAGRYNGEVEWHLFDIREICRTYAVPYAEKRRGKCAGRIRFHAWGPLLKQWRGSGEIRMHDAHFWSPITFKVFGVLGMPARQESWLHSGELGFTVENGLVYLERGTLRGGEYVLDLQGIADLDGACDMELSYRGTTIAIRGTFDSPVVKILPLDAITLPFDRLFRTRLRERGQR